MLLKHISMLISLLFRPKKNRHYREQRSFLLWNPPQTNQQTGWSKQIHLFQINRGSCWMGFCAHGVWWINKWVKTLFLFNIRYNFFSAFFLVWFCFEETVLWRRFMYLERFILLRWQKNYASPRLKPNASAFIITLSICTLKMTPQPSNRSFVSIFLHIYQQRKKSPCETWQAEWCLLLLISFL